MTEEFKPTWRYGPGGQSKICYSEDDIPEGWQDHPSKVKEYPAEEYPAEEDPAEEDPAEEDPAEEDPAEKETGEPEALDL